MTRKVLNPPAINKFCIGLLGLLLGPAVFAGPLSLFENGKNCVAYRAKKQWTYLVTRKVVGQTCDVTAQVIPELGDKFHIEIEIPVQSFNSGEVERDRDVMKILKGRSHPNLVFRSHSRPQSEWREMYKRKRFVIEGQLMIGGNPRPVYADVALLETSNGVEVDGIVETGFKQLDLKPPQLVGGVLVRVKNELQLHVHLVGKNILGFDTITTSGSAQQPPPRPF